MQLKLFLLKQNKGTSDDDDLHHLSFSVLFKFRELYREARKKQWGDNLAIPPDLYLKNTNAAGTEDNDKNSPHEISCTDL